jgi:tetratricopeptide (TPR) repeat protein
MASLLRLFPSISFQYLQNAYQVFVHRAACFSVMKVREDPLAVFQRRARERHQDSNFSAPPNALAECLLAEVHLHMYRYNGDMTPSRLDQARRAAETALQLAPKLPQSHLATAQYYYFGPRDYERALRELTATPSATADRAEFVNLAALTERRLGHWKDAIRDGERAAELDPQNPFILNELVESYISVRRFPDAERLADKGIKAMVTQNGHLAGLKSEALLGMGRIKEAGAVLENSPGDMTRLYHSVVAAMFARDSPELFDCWKTQRLLKKSVT